MKRGNRGGAHGPGFAGIVPSATIGSRGTFAGGRHAGVTAKAAACDNRACACHDVFLGRAGTQRRPVLPQQDHRTLAGYGQKPARGGR